MSFYKRKKEMMMKKKNLLVFALAIGAPCLMAKVQPEYAMSPHKRSQIIEANRKKITGLVKEIKDISATRAQSIDEVLMLQDQAAAIIPTLDTPASRKKYTDMLSDASTKKSNEITKSLLNRVLKRHQARQDLAAGAERRRGRWRDQ